MTPEAKRIAIAEACGWKRKTSELGWNLGDGRIWKEWFEMPGLPACEAHCLPDYLNDLNEMHEAEKVLTREQIPEYVRLIWDQVSATCPDYINQAAFFIATATAAQRADAFLLTFGLLKP